MKLAKSKLVQIIREELEAASVNEWFLSKKKEDLIDKALAGMRASPAEKAKTKKAAEDPERVPDEIQKKVDKNEKMDIPSMAMYDEETGDWHVEELN